jgi:hypothetical protein
MIEAFGDALFLLCKSAAIGLVIAILIELFSGDAHDI